MSLKNINEIQTNDYRYYDQDFLKNTLSALANSGQRFGSAGDGITVSYFTLADVITRDEDPEWSSYSYIKIETAISNSDIADYRSMYGVSSDSQYSYFDYKYIYKEDDCWYESEDYFNEYRTDFILSCQSDNWNDIVVINTGSLSKKINSSYIHTLCNYANSITYTRPDGVAGTFNYVSAFDCFGSATGEFGYLYAGVKSMPAGQSSNTSATFKISDASFLIENIRTSLQQDFINTYIDSEEYNIYVLSNWGTAVPSSKDVLCNALYTSVNNYAGMSIISNLFENTLSVAPASSIVCAANHTLLLNKKETSDVSFIALKKESNIYKEYELGKEEKANVSICANILSDIVSNGINEVKKSVNSKLKESVKELFSVSLIRNIAYDYVAEYISNKSTTELDDYITFNSYFSPDFKFNVFSSTTDSSIIYGTAESVHGECCTAFDVEAAVEQRIIQHTDSDVRTKRFIVDWSGILKEVQDNNRFFEVYDKNVLFNIKVDYSDDAYGNKNLKYEDIYVSSEYIFPFIDQSGYWCINGQTTSVKAFGSDATSPSVIILYSDDGEHVEIKTSLYKEDLSNYVGFADTQISLSSDRTSNIFTVSTPIITFENVETVSDIKSDIIKFVKSALIMSVTRLSATTGGIKSGGCVTTFWTFDEDTYTFKVITDSNNNALDLSTMAAVSAIVEQSQSIINIDPGKYEHNQLILHTDIDHFKQEESVSEKHILGAIQNIGDFDDKATADAYGFLPYNTKVNKISPRLTATIGFFDSSAQDTSLTYENGSIKYSQSNILGVKFNENNKVAYRVGQYRYGPNYTDENYRFVETDDYIPGAPDKTGESQVSILDTSSVFINHSNLLNRVNIMSLDGADGSFYYSYIGTSYNNVNKSSLIIGTDVNNVDASRHIIRPEDAGKFVEQNAIDINFSQINLNGAVNMQSQRLTWTRIGNTSLYYLIACINMKSARPATKTQTYDATPYISRSTKTVAYYINIPTELYRQYNIRSISTDTYYVYIKDYNGDSSPTPLSYILIYCAAQKIGETYHIVTSYQLLTSASCLY